MGNTKQKGTTPRLPTKSERMQWDYDKKENEIMIARARSATVKSQIIRAYETLENIRFDFVSDSAFRGTIVKAKHGLEQALGDFLLDEDYWKKRLAEHRKMTPKEYADSQVQPVAVSSSPIK